MNVVAMVKHKKYTILIPKLETKYAEAHIMGWMSYKNSDRKYLSNKIGSLTCCNLQMMIIKGLDETHIINTQC